MLNEQEVSPPVLLLDALQKRLTPVSHLAMTWRRELSWGEHKHSSEPMCWFIC